MYMKKCEYMLATFCETKNNTNPPSGSVLKIQKNIILMMTFSIFLEVDIQPHQKV